MSRLWSDETKTRAALLSILLAASSPGCNFFYVGRTPLEVAAENGTIARGVSIAELRSILGNPEQIRTQYSYRAMEYRYRTATLGAAWTQMVLGVFALGVPWFIPPQHWKYQSVLTYDETVIDADVSLTETSEWPEMRESMRPRTEILSDPSGARIEVDDEFVGEAPASVTWGFLGNVFLKNHVLRALPTDQGQFTQSKFFSAGQTVPRRVIFDTRLDTVRPKERIQVESK